MFTEQLNRLGFRETAPAENKKQKMNRLAVILALVVCAAANAQGFRLRRSDDEAAAAAADRAAEPKVEEVPNEADLKTRFGPLGGGFSSFTSSKTVSSVVANEPYGYGPYGDYYDGYGDYPAAYGAYGYGGAAYDPAFGYGGYGAYGAIPNVNFQSIGPNGRPAVSYESPNFGFYFRSKDAVKDV